MQRATLHFWPKVRWSASSPGFSLVEGVLAGTVLALIALAAVSALTQGRESSSVAARHNQALLLAEEGLEASRNIRDENFALLAAGTHGLLASNGTWTLSGSSDVIGEFTRSITITDIDASRKNIRTTVAWLQSAQRTGEVALETILTNWKETAALPTSCALLCQTLGYSTGTCRANIAQCVINGETNELLGDSLCTGGSAADTCCCHP